MAPPIVATARQRLVLAMIDEENAGEEVRIKVVLGWQDNAFEGKATGPRSETARARLVAEATLRAVERVVEGRIGFDLTAVDTTSLGGSQIALASVQARDSFDSYVGSAKLREADPAKATARAVLAAINRCLESVIG